MVALNLTISIIKLIPNKKGKLFGLYKNNKNSFQIQRQRQTKSKKKWGKIYHTNTL